MKFYLMLILFILSLTFITSCKNEANVNEYPIQKVSKQNEELLHNFITNKLLGTYGVHTNYLDTEQNNEVATGHEVLSESSGLLMRYYEIKGNQSLFDQTWQLTKKVFQTDSGFSYRYSPLHNKLYKVNATVDDLRVIRALYEASDKFGEKQYKRLADELANTLYAYSVYDNQLYDFYDSTYLITNQFITLCYIDLKTLNQLPKNPSKKSLISNMTSIVQNGYISDDFPFYETRFNYETGKYETDMVNMVESLLTVLSLAEVNLYEHNTIAFLKQKITDRSLFGHYSKDGKALSNVQSTGVYAIAAMIGAVIEDETLYAESIDAMEQFLVLDSTHEFYGAFGNKDTLELYSFDNLQALLAYIYE